MEHENTGEPVLCPICGAPEYNSCGHLVADFDMTFNECEGGEFYDVLHEFRNAMESDFHNRRVNNARNAFTDEVLEEVWSEAEFEDDGEGGFYCRLQTFSLLRFFERLLIESGAVSAGSDIVHNGPPGMSSSYVVLFAPEPDHTILAARQALLRRLSEQSGS